MPLQANAQAENLQPGMFVQLRNGAAGRLRALYRFESDLAPSVNHDRALLAMIDGTKGDVRVSDIACRVVVRPVLSVARL
jgi:hypothetical protein